MYRIPLLLAAASLAACATNGHYTSVDKHKRYVAVYSSDDERAALSTAKEDSRADKSLASLKQEVKKNRKDIKSWLNLSRLYLARGDLKNAEESAKEALRVDFRSRSAKKILAQVALRRGKNNLARVILSGIGGESLRDSQVQNLLAQLALAEGKNARALMLFKRSIEIDASNVSARMNLGVMYLKYRQLYAAAIQFERVLKIMPKNFDAMLHLAIVKTARGEYESAEGVYNTVLAAQPKNPLALYNLAVLQMQQKEYDDAISNLKGYLKTATEKDQGTEEAFALLEQIKVLKSQQGEAMNDEEINYLAEELEDRASRSAAYSQKAKGKKRRKSKDEREIEELERVISQ